MKIYIVPAWYPQGEQDVRAIFFREQAQALAQRGHDVTVLHIEPISIANVLRKPWHSKRIWQDGNVRTIFHKVIVPIPGKLANTQEKYISDLYHKIIKNQIADDDKIGLGKPDLMHAHVSHSCGYYCLKAAEELKLPLVVTEHYSGLLLGTATSREYRRVKDTIQKSDSFIFVGSNFQKTLCERLEISKPTYVVPNMVNSTFFEGNQDNVPGIAGFTFLSACHLKKNKSIDLVIRAFHKEFEKNEQVRLMIAGAGEELGALCALADELGETDRISFFGEYTREQGKELFASANVFVLTSKVETFGIVYIEALAAGVPCIATRGQGGDDIINDSNGALVEYGDENELCAAMRKLYENHGRYDKNAIKEDCKARFSDDAICRQIEGVYRSLLAESEEEQ